MLGRRAILQLGSLSSLAGPSAAGSRKENQNADLAASPLSPVPALEELASDRMVHHLDDLFAAPGLQNEWGHAQATKSVSGITSITFPPFACCGTPRLLFTPGLIPTCELMLNGRLSVAYPLPMGKITYQWFPHCVVRETEIEQIRIRTRAFLPSRHRAVAQEITALNGSREPRRLTLGFVLRAFVEVQPRASNDRDEADELLTALPGKSCVVFHSRDGRAYSVQGVSPACEKILQGRMPAYLFELGPGQRATFRYVNAIAENGERALTEYETLQQGFDQAWRENEAEFTRRIRAAFTPRNHVFSGSLPALRTRSRALWKLYYTGFTNLLYSRVDSPASVIGPAYVTLRPRWATTNSYLWDAELTSFSLALLDPDPFRRLIELWLVQNLDNHYATSYTTGKPVGPWYAVNNLAVLRSAHNYLRVSGDVAWLDRMVEGRSVLDHLKTHALRWKQLDRRSVGLADYGNIDNLLEVVSTYTHEVAATNSGNVYGMRVAAALLDRKQRHAEARELRAEATELAKRIIRLLYVPGQGYWKCGQPDGSYREVRHAYDFLTVLDCMQDDLGPDIAAEMCAFFWRELHSKTWMHALSPLDVDSSWNYRADHSWLGAYAAWPSMSAKVLLRAEKPENAARVAEWIRGLAKSANQGPFGQAHIVETVVRPENGGALKCPPEQPYGNDWCEVSGGSFIDLILEDVFGLNPQLDGNLAVRPRLALFDSRTALAGFRCHGKLYDIDAQGARVAS